MPWYVKLASAIIIVSAVPGAIVLFKKLANPNG